MGCWQDFHNRRDNKMGQQKGGMTEDPDYLPPKKPGEMHRHAIRGLTTGNVIGAGDEGEAQASRNRALASIKSTNPSLAGWDSRDINLPVEKPRAATKRATTRKVTGKR